MPTEGFVLNKKVGGYAGYWGAFRQAYVRVYDPRGFEFEITVPNLLFLLEHTSSIKGKGLEGEFVYGWDGTDLVLLPTCSPDYEQLERLNAQRFKNETIKAKDLKIGATYLRNNNSEWVYMGRFDCYESGYTCNGQWFSSYRKASEYANENGSVETSRTWGGVQKREKTEWGIGNAGKRHFFYDRADKCFRQPKSLSGLLIDIIDGAPVSDYSELFEKMESDPSYSPYDESKDERVPYQLSELKEKVDNRGWGYSVKSEEGYEIEICRCSQDSAAEAYTCQFRYGEPMKEYFLHKKREWSYGPSYEMIPVPFETIFNKFHFYYTKQYLANGKFYRTVY